MTAKAPRNSETSIRNTVDKAQSQTAQLMSAVDDYSTKLNATTDKIIANEKEIARNRLVHDGQALDLEKLRFNHAKDQEKKVNKFTSDVELLRTGLNARINGMEVRDNRSIPV